MTTVTRELIDRFVQSAENTAATIEVIPASPDSLNSSLLKATEDDDEVLFASSGRIAPELFASFLAQKKVITNPDNNQWKTVNTGITDSFCGVASTGSVCVEASQSFAAPVSMLIRNHIVVLDSTAIVPMPRSVFDEHYLNGYGLKVSFTFITGPSATADMGPLVRGVHGPGKLHIIVLQ